MSHAQNPTLGVLFGLATAVVGSLAGAATKHLASSVSVAQIVCFQYLLSCLVCMPWIARHGLNGLKTQRIGQHLIRGLAGWGCFYTYYLALAHTPLVDAVLLRNAAPLWVPLVVLCWSRIMVPRSHWLPMGIGFIGIILVLQPGNDSIGSWHLIGALSGLTLAISMVGTRRLSETEPTQRILFYYFFISFLTSVPLAAHSWQPIAIGDWPLMFFVGFSIYLLMFFYTKAYSYAPASLVSPLTYFSVVFAGLLGWLIWGDQPGLLSLAGMSLVIIGGLLTVLLGKKQSLKR
ncbi:DMT family transporter [Kistimonas scapharcae]|uniref:DMT family transporter n=1 Tax=Kistimonas scapharcae TaxID=1036133 RepID=A0ABP8UWQ7_9GAMM